MVARVALTLLICVLLPRLVAADGCILKKGGGYVPERSQVAFIEWENGQERLYVATKADQSAEPTVWIVPVPANPERVKAEPVEKFPRVMGQNQLRKLRRRVEEMQTDVLWRNTGLPLFLFLLGSQAQATFSTVGGVLPTEGVKVYSAVERHGMVVQVLTAKSAAALNAYLQDRNLGVRAEQLHSLATYLGQECALICAWRSEATSTARALRIDFPTPQVFYPMLPTRVYQHEVHASIFVRGWVQPLAVSQQPGLLCEQGLWRVREQDGAEALADYNYLEADQEKDGPAVALTRVIVSSHPRDWQADLLLEPAATVAPRVAEFLTAREGWLSCWLNVGWGLLLGWSLAWGLIPAPLRRWHDGPALALVGGTIFFSVFGMALAFWLWCSLRFPQTTGTREWRAMRVFLLLTGVILFTMAIFMAQVADHASFVMYQINGLMLLGLGLVCILPAVSAARCAYQTFRERAGWLLIFLAGHGALVLMSCQALLAWLPG